MPLNDYPTAKPTYDFYDTVNADKDHYRERLFGVGDAERAGRELPAGSATYHWHSAAPVASYLVEDSVGNYTFSVAPSNPTPFGLFSGSATYQRPATAYIALWQILGTDRFTKVLQTIQQTYGGGSITESQLEAAYLGGLPNKSAACQNLISQFFTEWFDTALPQRYRHRAGHHRAWTGRARLLRRARR